MCTKTISFTIPMEKEVLYKTAVHLISLAGLEVDIVEKGGSVVVSGGAPAYEPDTVAEFNADTPEAMGDRIDEKAAAATAPPAETDTGLDEDDRPWDERIDSGAKTKTADGRWKLRRGVDKAFVERVLAEYKNVTAPVPAAETPAPPAPAPVAETPVPPAPAPAAPTPPPPVEESGLHSFEDFKGLVMDRIQGAGLQPSDLQTAVTMAGSTASGMMPSIQNETPEMIDAIYKQLVALWAERDSKAA